MKKNKHIYYLLFFVAVSHFSYAQQSIGAGISTFHSVGIDFMRYGFTASLEQPRNEVNTFFLRGVYTFPIKFEDVIEIEKDYGITPTPPGPPKMDVGIVRKTSLFSVEGGTRYYLLNTYDMGTAIYGGFHMKGYIASYSEDIDNDFIVPEGYTPIERTPKQTSLLMSFGANIGFKYQLPMGNAINFDIVGDLVRALHDPAYILGNEILPICISLNLSYRFDQF